MNSVWECEVTLVDLLEGSKTQSVVIKGCFSQCAVLPIAQFEKHLYL